MVDVGANYGEIALSRSYPSAREVHLVEANPVVCGFLRRSVAALGDARVQCHEGAASDTDGSVTLRIHRRSSGLSSILPGEGGEVMEVASFRLDRLIQCNSEDRVAFKIDVEGAEFAVLRGIEGLLESAHSWAGIAEIQHIDVDYAAFLLERFNVFHIEKGSYRLVGVTGVQALMQQPSWATNDAVLLPPC